MISISRSFSTESACLELDYNTIAKDHRSRIPG